MVFIFNLLPIFFVLSLVVIVYSVVKERAIVRATGMSETSPVCAKCHYRLGGWTSSVCPECGEDVREVGVRVRAKSNRLIFGFVFFFVSFATITPLAMYFVDWAFPSSSNRVKGNFESLLAPKLIVVTDTLYRWQRFPPLDTNETTMYLIYLSTEIQPNGNGYIEYPDIDTDRVQHVSLTETSWLSGDNEIEHALRYVFGTNESEEVILKHVHSLKELSKSILDSYAEGIEEYEVISTWSDSTFTNMGADYFATSARTIAGAQDRITLGVAPISFVFCLLLSLQLTKMFIKPYSRVPRENEWKMLHS